MTSGSIIDATQVMAQQQQELFNGSRALQGERGSAPATGQCGWWWVWARCPHALHRSALQEPGCWQTLEGTRAMTEKLWGYYGKKRRGWMTGGMASPSADPMSLGRVQRACLAQAVSCFCSHMVWELGWGPRSRPCPEKGNKAGEGPREQVLQGATEGTGAI